MINREEVDPSLVRKRIVGETTGILHTSSPHPGLTHRDHAFQTEYRLQSLKICLKMAIWYVKVLKYPYRRCP